IKFLDAEECVRRHRIPAAQVLAGSHGKLAQLKSDLRNAPFDGLEDLHALSDNLRPDTVPGKDRDFVSHSIHYMAKAGAGDQSASVHFLCITVGFRGPKDFSTPALSDPNVRCQFKSLKRLAVFYIAILLSRA